MEKISVLPGANRLSVSASELAGQFENKANSSLMVAENGAAPTRPLWTGFMRSAGVFPSRPAVVAEKRSVSYAELRDLACRIAGTIQSFPYFRSPHSTTEVPFRCPHAFADSLVP